MCIVYTSRHTYHSISVIRKKDIVLSKGGDLHLCNARKKSHLEVCPWCCNNKEGKNVSCKRKLLVMTECLNQIWVEGYHLKTIDKSWKKIKDNLKTIVNSALIFKDKINT